MSARMLHEPDDELYRAASFADGLEGKSSGLGNERIGTSLLEQLDDLLVRLIVGYQDNVVAVKSTC